MGRVSEWVAGFRTLESGSKAALFRASRKIPAMREKLKKHLILGMEVGAIVLSV